MVQYNKKVHTGIQGDTAMKKIGVFMGNVTQDYQKTVLQAVFKEANERGYTVFCFANFGAYGDKVLYAEGERSIMYLPDLTQLDGIIVGEDTFDLAGMGNEIYEYLKKNAKCPVVYLRVAREEFYSVVKTAARLMGFIPQRFLP